MSARTDDHRVVRGDRGRSSLEHSLGFAVVNALTFLAGLWLVLSPYVLDHQSTGTGFNGYWNDALAGTTLIVLGGTALVDPAAGRVSGRWRLPLGGWLVVAPFVLGYDLGRPAPQATASDIVTGVVVVGLWLAGVVCLTRRAP